MKRLPFKKIDAFAGGRSSGNPAAVIRLSCAESLPPEDMQRIGRELAGCVSEVVFMYPDEGVLTLRYFSAEREVAFCGHGTVAAMYDLIKNDPVMKLDPVIRIRAGGGELLVKNEIPETDAVFISSPLPVPGPEPPSRDAIAAALRMAPPDIDAQRRIAVVTAGLAALMVPIRSVDAVLSIHPDQSFLREFCLSHGIEIVVVFAEDPEREEIGVRSRVFAPVFGYLEDPATGSGNAALGYYLLEDGAWDGSALVIGQGRSREHPAIVRLAADLSTHQRTVFFGGGAVVRFEGEYILSE